MGLIGIFASAKLGDFFITRKFPTKKIAFLTFRKEKFVAFLAQNRTFTQTTHFLICNDSE
jgi:hypothetical protein